MWRSFFSGDIAPAYTPKQIMDYCWRDVLALEQLLPVMLPAIDLPRALLRGRYMAAVSAPEFYGTPISSASNMAWAHIRWHCASASR
jgi:hypothetical protein